MLDPLSLFMSWASKKALDATYGRVVAWFKKESPRSILIIGPGGVGKSTLGHFLAGTVAEDAGRGEYVESVGTEEFWLDDSRRVQIIVPPGQSRRRPSTWDQVLETVKEGNVRGIILIAAYGHHAIGDISYKNHRLFDAKKGFDQFVDDYLRDCLDQEDRVLKTICEAINLCDKPIWLLTLVTKQDLWFDQRDAVERHYSQDKYATIMKSCLGRKTEAIFRHETVFVSLVIRNLMTGRGEVLKNTIGGYDAPAQEVSFERLLQVFDALMQWEEQHG